MRVLESEGMRSRAGRRVANDRQTARGGARAGFGWAGYGGKDVARRRRADRMRLAYRFGRAGPAGPARQTPRPGRRSGRADIDRSNGRTAHAAPARLVVVDLDAELRGVAKERLELGGDRRVIGAGESGRGHRRRRRGGEKLNDERERDEKGRKWRPERRRAALCAPRPRHKFPAAEAHQHIPPMLYSVAECVRERNSWRPRRAANAQK